MSEERSRYLVFCGRAIDWGVPAASVPGLAAVAEWSGPRVERALEQLGFDSADPGSSERIVVLRAGQCESPWRVRARVEVVDLDETEICAIPAVVLSSPTSLFLGVVRREGRRPLLLLDAARLR